MNQEILKKQLNYDSETGIFTRILKTAPNAGVGYVNNNGYRKISILNKQYYAHRLAWLYVHNEWPDNIDHINGNPLDNRIANLRSGTHGQNMQNMRLKPKSNTSGFMGVNWSKEKNKWEAQIKVKNKKVFLGYFDEAKIAHEAYLKAKRKLHEFCSI